MQLILNTKIFIVSIIVVAFDQKPQISVRREDHRLGSNRNEEKERTKMDAIRKQLDVLMGANRNGDVQEVNRKYYDRDVCRLYLSGLCPHDLFQLTVRIYISSNLSPCLVIFSVYCLVVSLKKTPNFTFELILCFCVSSS